MGSLQASTACLVFCYILIMTFSQKSLNRNRVVSVAFATTAMTKNILKPKHTSIPTDHNQTLQRTSKLPLLHLPEQPKSLNVPKLGLSSAILSAMVSSGDPAWAVQQVADAAEGDNRLLILILPIVIAISWVMFNIPGPALNQIERMRSEKGIIVGFGLGGLVASNFFFRQEALASEIAMTSDNQTTLLLVFIGTALIWVGSLQKPASTRPPSKAIRSDFIRLDLGRKDSYLQ